MRSRTLCILLTLATPACVSGPTEHRPAPLPSPPTAALPIEKQIAELERASQPGPNHKELLVLRGDWAVRLVDVPFEGGETELAQGTATIRSEFGGRFLRWDATMQFGNSLHATTGFLGFDLASHEYQSLMINDMGTGMSVATGTGNLEHGGIRFTLELVDRDSGGRARMSSVLRMSDADHFAQDLLGVDAQGKERALRRYLYTRTTADPRPITK
jgi:hypothetical protein